ncbi:MULTISPECIES: DUF4157 domain-containing protein [unclassified Streptomyces]|uniref:eCIS core domain-containing protein n=1 Tax=unclassified Streptomyces TaxID=2593676 RepID=UPI00380A4FD9
MSPQALLTLQRTAGNAAVTRMVEEARHQHGPGCGHRQSAQAAVQRSAVHAVLRTPGRPLDDATRSDMEARLGADFSDVRIHTDSAARASASEVGAHAYTSGSHIVIGDGGTDKHTLAHELTHVIQQRQGPVAGTDNGSGLKVSDPSDRFEREAVANATRAMSPAHQPSSEARTSPEPAGSSSAGTAIQRCYYCADDTCVDGADCGRSTDHHGLFSAGLATSTVAPYNEAGRVRTGGAYENEHMLPGAAYRGAGMGNMYRTAPTYRVDIPTHRAGVRGGVGGGGITSTGSGTVARGWSSSLADQLSAGNHLEAIRMSMTDAFNAAWTQGTLTEERVREIANTVYAHVTQGLITQEQAGELVNTLYNRWLDLPR